MISFVATPKEAELADRKRAACSALTLREDPAPARFTASAARPTSSTHTQYIERPGMSTGRDGSCLIPRGVRLRRSRRPDAERSSRDADTSEAGPWQFRDGTRSFAPLLLLAVTGTCPVGRRLSVSSPSVVFRNSDITG